MTTITQLKEVKEISDEQLLALDTLEETLSLPLGSLKTFMEEYLNGKYARLAAENTFTQNNTMNGVLYFKNGNNTPAGINQGDSGQLYISATGGVDMTSPTSVTVPVPDNNDRSQKAAPTEWVLTQMGRLGGLPTGSIVAWSGSVAPDGWLLCNGGELSRTTYAPLYELLGVRYTPITNLYKLGEVTYSTTPPTYNASNFCITPTGNGQYVIPPQSFNSSNFELYIVIYTHTLKDNDRFLCYHSSSHEGFEMEFGNSTLRLVYSTNGSSYSSVNTTWTTASAYTWYSVHVKVTSSSFVIDYAECESPTEYGTKQDVTKLQYTNCLNQSLSAPIYTSSEMNLTYGCSDRRNTEWFDGEIDLLRTTPSCCVDNTEKNSTFNLPNKKIASLKVFGNGLTLGLLTNKGNAGLTSWSDSGYCRVAYRGSMYGQPAQTTFSGNETGAAYASIGITRNSANSGIEVEPDYQLKYIIKY